MGELGSCTPAPAIAASAIALASVQVYLSIDVVHA